MKKAPVIVLLGNSVFMDGIAKYLVDQMAIDIVRGDDLSAILRTDLRLISPDIIVFELESQPAEALIHQMTDIPHVQWVALDPHCSQVSVISSSRFTTKAMKDLLRVIQEVLSGTEGSKGGKWTESLQRKLKIEN